MSLTDSLSGSDGLGGSIGSRLGTRLGGLAEREREPINRLEQAVGREFALVLLFGLCRGC
jgi:hypothetical protein